MGEEAVINYQLAIKKAKQAAAENESDRAIKLCEKALRIMNTPEAQDLLIKFKNDKFNVNNSPPPTNVKRPAPPPPGAKTNSLPKQSSNINDNTSSPLRPTTSAKYKSDQNTSSNTASSPRPQSPINYNSNPATPPPLPKNNPVASAKSKPTKSPPPVPKSTKSVEVESKPTKPVEPTSESKTSESNASESNTPESNSVQTPSQLQITKTLELKTQMESETSSKTTPYLYQILNLPSQNYTEIEPSQIKKAYFKISKLIHPDKHTESGEEGIENVLEAFKQVKQAYETLIDHEQRNYYHYDLENPDGADKYLEDNDPRPQHVETYTRADGLVYSGEIDRSGLAHGYGTLQFDPKKHNFKQITDENGHAKTLKVLPMGENFKLERSVTRCVSSNFANDEIIETEVSIEFIAPNSSDMNYKGEYKFSETSNLILRHGRGKMCYPDGSTYEGTWSNDFFHTFKSTRTASFSQEEFSSDEGEKEEEKTKHTDQTPSVFCNKSDSSKYIGEFSHGFKYGSGIMRFFKDATSPNSSYTGGFKRDAFSGYGTFTNEERQYDGQWKDGKYNGFGRLRIFANSVNGRLMKLNQPTDLEGTFKEDLPHGKNMTYFVPGHGTFRGEYDMGQRGHGFVQK